MSRLQVFSSSDDSLLQSYCMIFAATSSVLTSSDEQLVSPKRHEVKTKTAALALILIQVICRACQNYHTINYNLFPTRLHIVKKGVRISSLTSLTERCFLFYLRLALPNDIFLHGISLFYFTWCYFSLTSQQK